MPLYGWMGTRSLCAPRGTHTRPSNAVSVPSTHHHGHSYYISSFTAPHSPCASYIRSFSVTHHWLRDLEKVRTLGSGRNILRWL